jgi:hypothetical membrane protein
VFSAFVDERDYLWGSRTGLAIVVGGAAWILATLQFFVAQLVTASVWNPAYSWTDNYISDLGNTACGEYAVPHGVATYVCSPLFPLMNASFVVAGILTLVGAILLRPIWPGRRLIAFALGLWIVAGLGKVLVGLDPENTDVQLHLLGALNIPIESLAILLTSIAILQTDLALALVGVVLALVGLGGTVLSTAGQIVGPAAYVGFGVGGMERLADYPGNVWTVLIGIVAIGWVFGLVGHRPLLTAERAA